MEITNNIKILFYLSGLTTPYISSAEEFNNTNNQLFPATAELDFYKIKIVAGIDNPHWLDNDRIIFTGYLKDSKVEHQPGIPSYQSVGHTVLVWNIKTGEFTQHMKGKVKCVDSMTGYVQIDATPSTVLVNQSPRNYLKGNWGRNGEKLVAYRRFQV